MIAGRKTIEGRLNRGKFADYAVGDIVMLRRDVRDKNGVLHDGEPGAATVKIVAINKYPDFLTMTQTEDYKKVIPYASSAQIAANEYNKFYSMEDQKRYGVLAIKVRVMRT